MVGWIGSGRFAEDVIHAVSDHASIFRRGEIMNRVTSWMCRNPVCSHGVVFR